MASEIEDNKSNHLSEEDKKNLNIALSRGLAIAKLNPNLMQKNSNEFSILQLYRDYILHLFEILAS